MTGLNYGYNFNNGLAGSPINDISTPTFDVNALIAQNNERLLGQSGMALKPTLGQQVKSLIPGTKTLGTIGSGIQAGAAALGAYNLYKTRKDNRNTFNINRAAMNRDIANQATLVNNQLEGQASSAAQSLGLAYGTPEYRAYIAQNAKRVDGSAI